MQKITPFLWFDHQAEEAARFYTSIFRNSRIGTIARYDAGAAAASGQPEGSVMTVAFELDGQGFTALNGGPHFQFTEAISFVVNCESQDEVDETWDKLSEGGEIQQCGWLKDKYGVAWQVVPVALFDMVSDPDPAKVSRVMTALMEMKKLDLPALERAYNGQ